MFAVINSVGLLGLNAFAVKVEIEASKGLPSFDIVGLADASVKAVNVCVLHCVQAR